MTADGVDRRQGKAGRFHGGDDGAEARTSTATILDDGAYAGLRRSGRGPVLAITPVG